MALHLFWFQLNFTHNPNQTAYSPVIRVVMTSLHLLTALTLSHCKVPLLLQDTENITPNPESNYKPCY